MNGHQKTIAELKRLTVAVRKANASHRDVHGKDHGQSYHVAVNEVVPAHSRLLKAMLPVRRERGEQLAAAYEAALEEAKSIVRPLRESEKEVDSYAKILPMPTKLHMRMAKVLANRGAVEVLAERLIADLEQPIPASAICNPSKAASAGDTDQTFSTK